MDDSLVFSVRHESLIIIGERDPGKRAHQGIEASIAAFEREGGREMPFVWIGTGTITDHSVSGVLRDSIGIWVAPGEYENPAGAVRAIEFARKQRVPFLGTCGGFQFGLIEFVRNVLGRSAEHEELNPQAVDPVITRLTPSLVGTKAKVLAEPEFVGVLGSRESVDEFNCEYGLRADLERVFGGTPLKIAARDEFGQVRAFRLANHPFFVGTLFQPERKILTGELHPIVRSFFNVGSNRSVLTGEAEPS